MSLRARLVLSATLVALVALVGAELATYTALRSFLYEHVDLGLKEDFQSVAASIRSGRSASPESPSEPSATCPTLNGQVVDVGGLVPGSVVEVRRRDGTTLWRCVIAELGATRGVVPELPAHIAGLSPAGGPAVSFDVPAATGGDMFRARASILTSGPAQGAVLVIARPLSSTEGTLGRLFVLEVVVASIAAAVALALGWWLVRASLRPLRDVERTADAIAAGQLTERVPGDRARTEVGSLARALNVMLERIEGAFAERDRIEEDLRTSEERMRRFVADASHELRTPLAAVTAYADLFDRGAAENPDDFRRAIEGIQREAARMGHLVEDLLLLARLDEGAPLHRTQLDLVALAGEAVSTARALAPEWPIALRATRPVEVEADAMRLRQVIDNLVGNVRIHCPAGTATTVTVSLEGGDAVLAVSDDGPGLADEDAAHLFERFYRGDPSRSRERGGTGLGLAIVDAIVHAHGGSVAVSRAAEGGACFTVRLPAAHAHEDAAAGTQQRSGPRPSPGTPERSSRHEPAPRRTPAAPRSREGRAR